MNTSRLALWLALIVVSWAGSAAQAVEMKYTPKVGEPTQHRVMLAGRLTMETDSPFMQGFILDRAQVSARIDYVSKPVSRSGDTTNIEVEMTGSEVSITTAEGPEKTSLGSAEATMEVDSRLEVLDASFTTDEDYTSLSDDAAEAIDTFGVGAGGWWDLIDVLYLPEKDVTVGAEWTYEDTGADFVGAEGAPPLVVKYKLLELTTHAGRKCAKISTSLKYEFSEVDISPEEDEEGRMTTSGTLSGEYLSYYDYENSIQVYHEGSTGADVTVRFEHPDLPETEVRTKIVMNVKAALEP
ncbi:MAG: hypothetical protein JXA57_18020 [Armatimonadetes bacterium]|nr:hypothetical protein [Armatimonadota bacterium]